MMPTSSSVPNDDPKSGEKPAELCEKSTELCGEFSNLGGEFSGKVEQDRHDGGPR